jgi:hypothetical protein
VELLNELHRDHYTRYPQSKPVPAADNIADDTIDFLLSTVTRFTNPS